MRIKRNGPVVVIVTSARDNVEEELLTRLMTSDADESQGQTVAVLTDALSVEDRDVSEAEVQRWGDFQRWLTIAAPYNVVIPFRKAILAAYNKRLNALAARGEKPSIQLRLRRDVHGFLTAIKTSAILHKAQRMTDDRGRIVATIDDYRHAHEAFDEGLARLYKIKTPETALALVRAIEEMGATKDDGVKVTVSALMTASGTRKIVVSSSWLRQRPGMAARARASSSSRRLPKRSPSTLRPERFLACFHYRTTCCVK